jgi:hypothetical protein
LGTYTSADRATSVVYGLTDVDAAQAASFQGLLTMPFREPAPPPARATSSAQ